MTTAFILAGCASAGRTDAPPVLVSIAPDSVVVAPGSAVEVVIIGTGFQRGTPGTNVVHFGHTALRSIASADDGRRIAFVVPDAMESGGGAPPSRVMAGAYLVRVETAGGVSNALTLRVYR